MAARFMQYARIVGKQVPIFVAQEVQQAGYKRVIDAIDTDILKDTVERVRDAVEGDELLSESQKDRTSFITITEMPHTSRNDPIMHSSIICQTAEGECVCRSHVPKQNNQETAR